MNLDAFERYPLLFGPSPIHRLERLTGHLGGAQIWAKRDEESWEKALADVQAAGGCSRHDHVAARRPAPN